MHSELFSKACRDTRTAWEKTRISSMVVSGKVESLRTSLRESGAAEISRMLMAMSYAPYSGAATSIGLNDGKASQLSETLMTAILQPYVTMRRVGAEIDLGELKAGLVQWIDSGSLPEPMNKCAGDLRQITNLIGVPEARIALTAPFAAPLEFSILVLAQAEQAACAGVEHV